MAAPTNPRVESNSSTTTTLRWSDNGGASNGIYRSLDNSSYSLVDTIALGVELFVDTALDADTLYYYKVSNDGGSTFSTVVSVTTQQCDFHSKKAVRSIADGNPEELATHIEALLNERSVIGADSPSPFDQCFSCPVSGQLVLDCTLGCRSFLVENVQEDINSITIVGCGTCPPVDFQIPAGMTIGICGWPSALNCEFAGDECFEAPIEGGEEGRTARTVGASTPGIADPLPSGGGGATCQCPDFPTTVWCNQPGAPWRGEVISGPTCMVNNGGIINLGDECWWECEQNQPILFKACGGLAPYTWGSVNAEEFCDDPPSACFDDCVIPGCVGWSDNPTSENEQTTATPDTTYGSGGNDCSVNHELFYITVTDDAANTMVVPGWIGL